MARLRGTPHGMGLSTDCIATCAPCKQRGLGCAAAICPAAKPCSLHRTDEHHLTCVDCGSTVVAAELPMHGPTCSASSWVASAPVPHPRILFGLCAGCQEPPKLGLSPDSAEPKTRPSPYSAKNQFLIDGPGPLQSPQTAQVAVRLRLIRSKASPLALLG